MNSKYREGLTLVLVFATLLGFAVIIGRAIFLTLTSSGTPTFSLSFLYIANILTGLVGGTVAVGFGQSPPQMTDGHQSIITRNAAALGSLITSNPARPAINLPAPVSEAKLEMREIVGLIYATVYIVLALISIIVWVIYDNSPELIKNQATVSLGLFVPIVAAFFKQ